MSVVPRRACWCCGDTEYEIDPESGLCVYCQPCPGCGETGGDCPSAYDQCLRAGEQTT